MSTMQRALSVSGRRSSTVMDLRATSSIAGFVVLPPFVKFAQRNTLKSVTTGRPRDSFHIQCVAVFDTLENSRTISRGIVV